jgi:tetratricopeptide (TPR) repeat protein
MANAVEKGISELDEAVELVPGRPDAHFHRARGLHSLGRVEEALKEVDCALDCDGSFFPAEALKSALLKQTKTSSEIGANGAVSKGPAGGSWGAAWFSANRGVAEGRWEEAAGAYGQLIDLGIGGLEPYLGASVEFRLGRGNARLEMGDVNGAILDFAAARDRWPAALEPAILLGKAWYLKGEKKQAQSAFEEAFGQAKSGDRQNEVAVWISLICARLKDYERSLAWAERLGPGSTRERLRGGALIRLERLKDAEIAHREYIKLDEKSPIAYTGLGLVLWKQAKGKEAIDMYLKALELDPKYLWAHNNLGLALEWEGKTEEALQSFRRALELDSKFKTPLYNIGATLLSRGRYGEAIDAYKSAVGKGLDSAYSLRLLEDALVEKRDYKSAVGEGPDSAYSLRLLGDALFAKRDVEAAIETYKKSLALRPDPTTLNSLGIALERKGALKDAFAAFCDALEMNPRGNNPYVHLSRFLRQRDPSVFAEQLVRLKKNLEKVLSSEQEPPSFPELLQSLALALSRDTRRDDDLTEAFRYARLALEKTRRKDARPLATLARLQFTRGDKERAVLTLERASQLPHWEWSHQEELERYRKELLPHLASFASIDGALSSLDRELLVPGGASWRFFRGREEPPAAWMSPEFDDSTWESGPSGFGHGKYEAATLLNDMRGSYSSVYLRRTFSIEDSSQFEDFILRVRSDTGFIVYINGKEVARAGIGGEKTRIPFDGIANHDMVWHQPVYEFRSDPELFHAGRNVMAIQGLSASLESPDFLLLPVLDGQARCDRSRDGQLIQGLGPKGNNAAVHIAYLEGRLFDRAGKHREAAAKFLEVLTLENALPEPYFRLAESLRSEGDCAEARKVLQRAFQRGFGDDKTLWNLWAAISFVDLKLGLEEMLASLPLPAAKGQGAAALETFAEPKGDYARDLLWLLKTLQGEFAIRINCGGGKYRSSTGVPWEEDRFYSGGNLYEGARSVFALGIHGTDDDLLYRTERYFPSNEVTPAAYHFPLPTGSYRITLHFAEIYHKQPGKRCFDVLLEGTRVLKEYEPGSKGFATADEKTFNTEVKDGLLDIEFVPRVENPKISAIEIEPLK